MIITEGKRPLWQTIIAALCYTCTLLFVYMFFKEVSFDGESIRAGANLLYAGSFLFVIAVRFSLVKNVLFDLENKKYKHENQFGLIKLGKWEELPKIEYVSVFRQPLVNDDYIYEVNLWYNTNKHFCIYKHHESELVFNLGKQVAKRLEIDLLDATKPNNYNWIKL